MLMALFVFLFIGAFPFHTHVRFLFSEGRPLTRRFLLTSGRKKTTAHLRRMLAARVQLEQAASVEKNSLGILTCVPYQQTYFRFVC